MPSGFGALFILGSAGQAIFSNGLGPNPSNLGSIRVAQVQPCQLDEL
jgi:hypothetical protein